MQGSGNWTMNTKFKLPGPRPGLDCLIQVFEDEYLQEITYLYKVNTILTILLQQGKIADQ